MKARRVKSMDLCASLWGLCTGLWGPVQKSMGVCVSLWKSVYSNVYATSIQWSESIGALNQFDCVEVCWLAGLVSC